VIGEEIRNARIAAGLSQEELGFKAKLSRNYVSMVELNQNSPTLETLVRLCQALGVRACDTCRQGGTRESKGAACVEISPAKSGSKGMICGGDGTAG